MSSTPHLKPNTTARKEIPLCWSPPVTNSDRENNQLITITNEHRHRPVHPNSLDRPNKITDRVATHDRDHSRAHRRPGTSDRLPRRQGEPSDLVTSQTIGRGRHRNRVRDGKPPPLGVGRQNPAGASGPAPFCLLGALIGHILFDHIQGCAADRGDEVAVGP